MVKNKKSLKRFLCTKTLPFSLIFLLLFSGVVNAVWIYEDTDFLAGGFTLNTRSPQNLSYIAHNGNIPYTNISWDGTNYHNITYLTNFTCNAYFDVGPDVWTGGHDTNLLTDIDTGDIRFYAYLTDAGDSGWNLDSTSMQVINANDVVEETLTPIEYLSIPPHNVLFNATYTPTSVGHSDQGYFDVNVSFSAYNDTLEYSGYIYVEDLFKVYSVDPPYNHSGGFNATYQSINNSWSRGNNSDFDVVIRNNNSYPTTVSDGYVVQNTSSNYYNLSVTTADNFYLCVFSYNSTVNAYSTGLQMPWGGIQFQCYNESNPSHGLSFDIEVTNNNATETYTATGLSNGASISIEETPYGDDTVFIVSSSGYKDRIYTYDLVQNQYYNHTYFLPPLWSDQPDDEVPDDEQTLTSHTDTAGVTNHTVNVNITLDHTPEDITAVYLYNSSIYGGWVPIPEDNYSYDSGTNNVTVDAYVLDANTTLIRVDYTTYESRSVLETEAYLLHIINELNEPVDGALVTVKKYINTTETYQTVGSDITDGNGDVTFWLIPNTFYKIFITHDSYLDEIANFQPTTSLFTKTFMIYFNTTDPTVYYSFYEHIVYNATVISSGNIRVMYEDDFIETTDTQFYLYEDYNGTATLKDTTTNTSESSISFVVTGLNTSRLHYVDLFFNHTREFSIDTPVRAYAYPYGDDLIPSTIKKTMSTTLEARFESIVGENPLGWCNTITAAIAIILLLVFGSFNAGVGIIGSAAGLFFTQIIFSMYNQPFNIVLGGLIPFIVIIGVLYMLTKHPEEQL